MLRAYLGILLLALFSITNAVNAAMTSTNYQINFDSLNSGGTDFSSSTNFSLHDTLGEEGSGYTSSTNYLLHAGYRQTDEAEYVPTLELIVGAQEESTKTAYTAFDINNKTVTVASVVGFSSGTRIGVVENQGLNQKVVVGRVIDIDGLNLTVDNWDGTTSTMSAVPLGGDDWVYRTEGHAIPFGNLTQFGQAGIVATEVSTNATNGYTLQIKADGNFRTASGHHLHDVADGTVTAGNNEYGASVHGAFATSTGTDFSVTTAYRDIQQNSAEADADRIGMIFKVSIDTATVTGNYEQTISYLLTANF